MNRFGNRSLSVFTFAASAALLAACGGGGGGSSSPAAPTGLPTSAPQALHRATMTISFPVGHHTSSNRKSPQYISPSTTEMVVVVNTVNGGTPPGGAPISETTALTVGANCTISGGTETCTLSVIAPPGSVNYTFNATDGTSTLSTLTTTIVNTVGTDNLSSVTLQGIVAGTVSVSGAALTANTPVTAGETLVVTAYDADGNQIVNGSTSANYANPITLTDNDATGQTKLSVDGHPASSSVITSNPSDVVTLTYTGQATNSFTISASAPGVSGSAPADGGGTITATVSDITFTGTTLDDAAHGGLTTDVNYSEPTLFFTQPSGTLNVTGAETGWTNTPFSQQFDLVPGNGTGNTCGAGGGIATFSAGPATTFTITAHGVGICKVRLEEHGTGYPISSHPAPSSSTDTTHDGTFWISVTSSDVTVDAKHRH
jgi:hypothetical protein